MTGPLAPQPVSSAPGAPEVPIDRRRYLRVLAYFGRTFLHLLWFDLLLARPGLSWARPAPGERWRRLARRFRLLAIELGGVLIKLGQFLSTRVDVLPPEVTAELSGLQDRVPAVPFPELMARLEADLGLSHERLFARIDPEPAGAASLAQVHRARLTSGGAVVVKVLRPGIERLVETDLAATRVALGWLGLWRTIRNRVDLDRLFEEFAATTRAELDLEQEAANAERFGELFRDDPAIATPRIEHALSGRHTLTMEDVGTLRIGDHAALEAAGISRAAVARTLYRCYMEQLFVHHVIHCDPHPGNLFVQPVELGPAAAAPGAETEGGAEPAAELESGRPFRIVFIDFGMMTTVPPHLREAIRDYAIAFIGRDAAGVVAAARRAGVLLPGADIARLERAHADVFDRLWGVKLADIQGVALSEAGFFLREYRDLLYEAPFQFPVDLLFAFRAVGLLSGIATSLDPELDPWEETRPFAEKLAREEAGPLLERLTTRAGQLARVLLALPEELSRALRTAERGGIPVAATLAPDAARAAGRIGRAVEHLVWTVAAAALFLGGVQMELARPDSDAGAWLWAAAGAAFVWGLLRRR